MVQDIEQIRLNPLCVISIATFGEYEVHSIQTNSGWSKNPYGKDYAIVPDEMVQEIMETKGFCDIVLNDDKTEVVSFTVREIPVIEEPEMPITEMERMRADLDYAIILAEANYNT